MPIEPAPAAPRVIPYGDRAILIEVSDHRAALTLYEHLRHQQIPGLIDVIPAARTVVATFIDERNAATAGAQIDGRDIRPLPERAGPQIKIPVVYDGPDLPAIAEATGLAIPEIVTRHQAAEYVAAFLGFAPGFAYLTGLDPALHLPRRATPRSHVPAGSVAIASEFTAVYPAESPGGWHLLGHTTAQMWSLARQPPALVQPGTRVRFTAAAP